MIRASAASITLFTAACLVAACTGAATTPSGAAPGASGSLQLASIQPSADPGATRNTSLPLTPITAPIVADIAKVAGVAVDLVAVQSVESMTFPDAGLGCPVPGMAYPQVQVDGYKVIAMVGGTTYDYRGTGPGAFRRCTPQK